MSYKLVTFDRDGRPAAGIVLQDGVYPVGDIPGFGASHASVLGLLEDWAVAEPLLAKAALTVGSRSGIALEQVHLRSPVLYPNAIFCAAANYRDHMRAMAAKLSQPEEPDPHELDIKPYHFVVPGRSCLAGPHDPIRLPSHAREVDWEIELVAVIGRTCRQVTPQEALSYVAGYTIGNDISVRDRRFIKIPNVSSQSVFQNDFIGMKGFDNGCAVGPWIVPAATIQDPQQLALKLWVNDELMQDSSTSQMVFSVAEQIAYLSSRVTLLPGDLVMTGTPAGTGMERSRFLKPGESVRLSVEHIGEMVQQVVS